MITAIVIGVAAFFAGYLLHRITVPHYVRRHPHKIFQTRRMYVWYDPYKKRVRVVWERRRRFNGTKA